MSLLFFTAADKKYEHFVPLYIYFALKHNADSFVEIVLEDVGRYRRENSSQIQFLEKLFPGRFALSEFDFSDYMPEVIRFICEPKNFNVCDYVYIGDIDILIMDNDVEKRHIDNIKDNRLPFSNVVRKGSYPHFPRLTGLHFSPMELQYPLPSLEGYDLSRRGKKPGADENVLFEIMKAKGCDFPLTAKFRPLHGIHVSSNRHPFGIRTDGQKISYDFQEIIENRQTVPWRGIEKEIYREKFKNILNDKSFQELYFHLDLKARSVINVLEYICAGRFSEYVDANKYLMESELGDVCKKMLRRYLRPDFFNLLVSARKRFSF